MLNLAYIFDDANAALAHYAHRLAVIPLPATVYLMQLDVLNHYQHALDHYFTLTLNEPYLQNSSLGTPFQKWAFFVNKNFDLLSFTIHNLLRYTSRLIHETQFPDGSESTEYIRAFKTQSNKYTGPLCDIKYQDKPIGIRVHDDKQLTITSIRTKPYPIRIMMRPGANGVAEYVRLTKDPAGREHEEPTDAAEFDRAIQSVDTETVNIHDRSHLHAIRDRGLHEITSLSERNRAFRRACSTYYATRNVAEPFRNLNEEYWI